MEAWQRSELPDVSAKVVIYEAFVEGKLEATKHLARTAHDLYFEPEYEEFRSRTIWRLPNAFTSAFKELEPIPQFKATAKLGEFLEVRFSQSFEVMGMVSADRHVTNSGRSTQRVTRVLDSRCDWDWGSPDARWPQMNLIVLFPGPLRAFFPTCSRIPRPMIGVDENLCAPSPSARAAENFSPE